MKKDLEINLSSPLTRTLIYFLLFVLGTVTFEALVYLTPSRSLVPGLFTIITFTLIGAVAVSQHNLLSKIVSASTLFMLSAIAIKFDSSPVPSIFLLVLALAISHLGGRSFLHRQRSTVQTLTYGLSSAIIAVLFVIILIVSTTILIRNAGFEGL